MPMGIVRAGDFRSGCPIIEPHVYGTPVNDPEPQGNVIPQANATLDTNPVTWAPTPTHFGNQVAFSLQSVPPIVVIAPGNTGTVNLNLTNLLGSNSATLTYSGAPSGVTLSFATNPDTSSSVVTVTVGASVPAGKYTITVTGTATAPNIETTNIHLVVS
jgi:aminopeptidase S